MAGILSSSHPAQVLSTRPFGKSVLVTEHLQSASRKAGVPPTETNPQRLPFEEIAWQDFEELCRLLAQAESAPGANWEECRPYGGRGQDQHQTPF